MNNAYTFVVMTMMTSIVNALSRILINELQTFINKLKYWYMEYIVNQKNITVTLREKRTDSGWMDAGGRSNIIFIQMFGIMRDNNLFSNQADVVGAAVFDPNKEKNHNRSYLSVVPKGKITYKGFTFSFAKRDIYQSKGGEDPNAGATCVERETTLTVSGPDMKQIQNFLDGLVRAYDKKITYVERAPCYYYQIPDTSGDKTGSFCVQNMKNQTTFDDIVGPHKGVIINALHNLKNSKIAKLGILLHGQPGTGKTSTIKAIAKATNRSIVQIKLSHVFNDADLMKIFFNGYLSGCPNHLPTKKRVFVFEDIDADTKIVHKRSEANSTNAAMMQLRNDKDNTIGMKELTVLELLKQKKESGATLAGLLNILDGVLELRKAIIIMTSNHRERLDPALIRSGRINLDLELKPLNTELANELIKKHFPTATDVVIVTSITPATLVDLCKKHDSFANLYQELETGGYISSS